MPLADLTLDTNVLLHSCNPIEGRHGASIEFLHCLLGCTTKLAIDEGFSLDPAQNRSLIGGEYLAKIVPGTLPSAVLTQLALTGRVTTFKSSVNAQAAKKLNQMVANRRDRTFIKVCANSVGRIFVSHDFDDFPPQKRKELGKIFALEVLEAVHCRVRL
jgi:hypothetical protein